MKKKSVSRKPKKEPSPPESCILPVEITDLWNFYHKHNDDLRSGGKLEQFNILFNFKIANASHKEVQETVFRFLLAEDYKGIKMLLEQGISMPPLFEGLNSDSEIYHNIYIRHPSSSELMNLLYLFPEGRPDRKSSWDLDELYKNPNYTLPTSLKDLSEDQKESISSNTGISLEYARKHVDELDWDLLSANPAFTSKQIEDNPDLPWTIPPKNGYIATEPSQIKRDGKGLDRSKDPTVRLWHIQQRPGVWNWSSDMYDTDADDMELEGENRFWGTVAQNPNITVGFVLANLGKIEFGEHGLSGNLFGKDKQVAGEIERERKGIYYQLPPLLL